MFQRLRQRFLHVQGESLLLASFDLMVADLDSRSKRERIDFLLLHLEEIRPSRCLRPSKPSGKTSISPSSLRHVRPNRSRWHDCKSFHSRDYLEKFFAEHELQLTNAYEQNNASLLTNLNPQLSADQLMSKRRLSSELFLKPNATVKRTKPSLHMNEHELVKHASDSPDLHDPPPTTIRSSSPTLSKKLSDETK